MSRVVIPGSGPLIQPGARMESHYTGVIVGRVAGRTMLVVGPGGTDLGPVDDVNEGGQLGFVGAGSHSSLVWLDRFQDRVRVIANSSAVMQWDENGSYLDKPIGVYVGGDLKVRQGVTPGDPTTETYLEVKVDDDFQVVSVGAGNSGGTGFRQLLVPNAVP